MQPDPLLQQATCAVLRGTLDQGAGEVAGTAWLASAAGHLLTAGHLLPAGSVGAWVRFPGTDAASWAVLVDGTQRYDQAEALDCALLRLAEPTTRTPLPMQLVVNPQGEVLVRGYPRNLPQAQSGDTGTFGLTYLRGSAPEHYLFSYRSLGLAVEGYSGAAVYSTASGAVVGVQVEAEPAAQLVFAMPLLRIATYWQDLVSVARQPPRGLCVVLLPASRTDSDRRRLVDDIIRPVVADQLNLEIYESTLGRTTAQDLARLEQADVVIADATHDDTYVTYELTVAQGLGTPDVVLAERGSVARLPFAAVELDLDQPDRAREAIQRRLLSVRAIYEAIGEAPANPITGFFHVPLTQVSAANALALGYALNFVRPVGTLLLEAAAGLDREVRVAGELLTGDRLRRLSLDVVLPERLSWCADEEIQRLLAGPRRVVDASVRAPGWSRPRTMKALPAADDQGIVHLVDAFPTTMATMVEAINQRLDVPNPTLPPTEAWRAIEAKEIDRFGSSLVRRVRSDQASVDGRRLRDICRVVHAADLFPDLPATG